MGEYKRFDCFENKWFSRTITDNGECIGAETAVGLLNSLNDENEQLKARIEHLERKIQRERNSHMKEHEKWEKEIQKENEQLKSELAEKRQEQEVIEYLQTYHNGNVNEFKKELRE